jgi:dTDP-4-amino-4,6-dideoxygalactose transaminase
MTLRSSNTSEAISPGGLAILGGNASFDRTLHVGRPNIGDRERLMERMNDMLDRRWLTNDGPYVQEFEQAVADYLDVKHCVAMCNGTVALEIAARAVDLKGEVIVPAYTFVATAHCLQWQEIRPVFCDIDPDTHCLDPEQVERHITPNTTGILGTHVWGQPCAVEELQDIADRHDLRLMFDAAHALGCAHDGTMLGNFGDAECFSFHATKFVNSFEGGAVTTNNDDLAEKMRLMRNFGFQGMDNVDYIGINGKMSEPSAAMGLTSLESIDEFIAVNRRNYEAYQRAIADIPGIKLFTYDGDQSNNYQYIVLEVDDSKTGLTRDQLFQVLMAENVKARRYFYPGVHRMEPYDSYYPNAGMLLPETEALCEHVLVMPTGTAVDEADIEQIGAILQYAIDHAEAVQVALTDISLIPNGTS